MNLAPFYGTFIQVDQDSWSLYEQPSTELLVHDWPKK